MSDYEKDPSRAEVGPLAEGAPTPLSSTRDMERGVIDEEEMEKGASREMSKPHKTRTVPAPTFDEGEDNWEHPTDTNVHGMGDLEGVRESIMDRVKKIQGEAQTRETGESLEREIQKQENEREEFKDQPTDVEVDRDDEVGKIRQLSGQAVDGTGGITKRSSDPISILEDSEANPVKIFLTLNNKFGEEWVEWEPETILEMADREGVEVKHTNRDKIMALKVIQNTDAFWEDPRTFEKVVLAFNHRIVDWGHVQEPRLHEVVGAIELIERYLKSLDFTEKIQAYVTVVAIRDGYVMLPPALDFAKFLFSEQLIDKMGDEALQRQERLRRMLDDDVENPTEEDAVQYRRILRCQYHAQEMINELKSE